MRLCRIDVPAAACWNQAHNQSIAKTGEEKATRIVKETEKRKNEIREVTVGIPVCK